MIAGPPRMELKQSEHEIHLEFQVMGICVWKFVRSFLAVLAIVAIGPASIWDPQFAAAQQGPQKTIVALQGGLLIDGTGAMPVADAVVIIEDDKIQKVGTSQSLQIPSGARIIDTTGKTIIPGLVDSHIHYRDSGAPLYLYWGVTTVGDMGNPQGWIFAQKRAYAKMNPPAPTIMAVGGILTGPAQPGDPESDSERSGFRGSGFRTFLRGNGHHYYVHNEAELESRIFEAKQLGSDGVKLYNRLSPDMMKLAVQVAHKHGLPVFAHYTTGTPRRGYFLGTDEVVDTGLDGHMHLYGLIKATVPDEIRKRIEKGEAFYAKHLMDTSKFPALIHKMVANKMYLNPTLGADQGKLSKHREEFDRANAAFWKTSVTNNIPEASRGSYLPTYKPFKGEDAAHEIEGYKKELRFVKEFVDAGGKVMAGSDSGALPNPYGLALHFEMQMLVEAGLTPMQAIQAATSWGMEAWRKNQEAGTVSAGKRADLVILNRNPLEDIAATRDIDQVIKSGVVIDRNNLTNWKEPYARPAPDQVGPANLGIRLPNITEISQDSFHKGQARIPELIIHGVQFSPQSHVIFNDRLLPTKFYSETQLGVQLTAEMLGQAGTFPLLVIRPGSGGGPSNPYYLIVTSD